MLTRQNILFENLFCSGNPCLIPPENISVHGILRKIHCMFNVSKIKCQCCAFGFNFMYELMCVCMFHLKISDYL